MQIMAHRSIHPPPEPVSAEPLRIQLETQMAIYVVGQADDKKDEQMPHIDRDRKKKNDEDLRFQKCFEWMEGIRRPG